MRERGERERGEREGGNEREIETDRPSRTRRDLEEMECWKV